MAPMSCHDLGSTICEWQSLRAPTVKAQSPLSPAKCVEQAARKDLLRGPKLCISSLTIKKRSDMSPEGPLQLSVNFKKKKKTASVERLNRGDMVWCCSFELAASGDR